jgi:hypothetical protein
MDCVYVYQTLISFEKTRWLMKRNKWTDLSPSACLCLFCSLLVCFSSQCSHFLLIRKLIKNCSTFWWTIGGRRVYVRVPADLKQLDGVGDESQDRSECVSAPVSSSLFYPVFVLTLTSSAQLKTVSKHHHPEDSLNCHLCVPIIS